MHATQQSQDEHPANCNNKKNELWQLEPHVCRRCFARIVSQPLPGGMRRFVCTNCGAEADGQNADAVCCCGIKIRKMGRTGKGGTLVDAGVRCIPNPNPTAMFPSLYVASEVKR